MGSNPMQIYLSIYLYTTKACREIWGVQLHSFATFASDGCMRSASRLGKEALVLIDRAVVWVFCSCWESYMSTNK